MLRFGIDLTSSLSETSGQRSIRQWRISGLRQSHRQARPIRPGALDAWASRR